MAAPDRPSALVDGEAVTSITITDRGLHYADALFETIRMRGDTAPLWSHHMLRLCRGAERLGMPAPDTGLLARECARLSAGKQASVCKIIYTRGSGGQAYSPPEDPRPVRVIMALEAPPLTPSGIAVTFCRTPLATSPALAGLKHCGRLEQVLARRELMGSGFDEGLMCDAGGRVVEATSANLFVVHDGIISTPELTSAGVAGVMRGRVLELLARDGYKVRERVLLPRDCQDAQALFLCNAVRGIMPVTRLQSRRLEIPSLVHNLAREVEMLFDGTNTVGGGGE